MEVWGRWKWLTPGIIQISRTPSSSPRQAVFQVHQSSSCWWSREATLLGRSEHWNQTVKTQIVSANRDPFFTEIFRIIQLDQKTELLSSSNFFHLSSFLCVKVCTVGIWYVCTCAYDLDQKSAGSYAPDNFFNQIHFANTQCTVYLPTFG